MAIVHTTYVAKISANGAHQGFLLRAAALTHQDRSGRVLTVLSLDEHWVATSALESPSATTRTAVISRS